ncbi:hypothetical protein LTR62_008592 [Meristemomyces frigidus]|uniref:Xylanolytic transcriptional activator regulatory domain-containing protein n=1 Tax=Meristemomyces frigidus TaxID=1508187 RepID=A0AAN7YH34_9PEZI|nr:hypothetical protein LTR62_008592 [Meristemomyces frigidus]
MDDLSYEWFSNEFYSAMQETGNNFGLEHFEDLINPPLSNHGLSQQSVDQGPVDPTLHECISSGQSGRVSRMASPPNEASEEDRRAFAWDPKSRAILHAAPIHIPLEHPLWTQHDHRFDISEATYQKVLDFATSRLEGIPQNSTLTLPSLQEANIMIGLYFKHFSPQMPVLHHATINTDQDLPPPLLSALLVIGAIYSNLRGTRRFAIVLLDIVRWRLQVAIEGDNSLMRDPRIIFAETLVCYVGLWCGNKRAFELAEVTRGTVVKHIFQFSQERLFWTSCFGEEDEAEEKEDALLSWRNAYLVNAPEHDSHATSVHFRQSAYTGLVLTSILLDVPFTDIQASFGKNGEAGMDTATQNLRQWMTAHSQIAEDIVYTAIETIDYLITKGVKQAASEQSVIAMFLCYALVWKFATLASRGSKERLLERISRNESSWKMPQVAYIKTQLEGPGDSGRSGRGSSSATGSSWGILRSAAQCLTQLGIWGAALNLALLLQRRSEM